MHNRPRPSPLLRRPLAALLAAALAAATLTLAAPPAAAWTVHGAYVAGAEPWTESDCAGETAVVAASDAAAQSDLYSAVTLAGALGSRCVILAGARTEPMPTAQLLRLDAAVGTVHVVGGLAAVPAAKIAGYRIERIAGADRWATAANVGAAASGTRPPTRTPGPPWDADCAGQAAVVAASDAAARSDLYSAVALAGALGSPCVVLAGARTEPMPAAQLARLRAAVGTVHVVGGVAAVPAAKVAGYRIERTAGADRWATAARVGAAASGTEPPKPPPATGDHPEPPAGTAVGIRPEQRIGHVTDWFTQIGLGQPIAVSFASGRCHAAAAACADSGTIYWTDSPSQIAGALMAHEYAHIWQHARAADVGLGSLPAWVVEGFAEYISHRYSPAEAPSERDLCGAPLGEDNELARMGPGQYSDSVYRAGELAFTHLVDDYGWAAVIDYWNTPGTHQQRFQTAYDTNADTWEREFHADACRRGLYLDFDNVNWGNDPEVGEHGLPRYALSFVNIDNPGWNNAVYPIDAIRLAPDIVFDEFLRQIQRQEGLTPSDIAPPYGFGAAFIDHPAAHTIAKNCGHRVLAGDTNFDVMLSAEAKISGEWHLAYIVLGNWANDERLPWKAETTPLLTCLRHLPTTIKYAAVSAGWEHSCWLRTDGTAVCWGNNAFGQSDAPAAKFAAVAAGVDHSCGLRVDGTVTCWGFDDGRADAPSDSFSAISVAGPTSCGLRTDNTVACWGDLGEAPAGKFSAVSAGAEHACGLRTDGTVTCWGSNRLGELDGVPLGTFTAVSARGFHACGLRTDGTVTCWGDNRDGEADAPAGKFFAVAVGPGLSCGLRTDGTVTCWGSNRFGELDGVPSGKFSSISVGLLYACGLRADGTAVCWGYSDDNRAQLPPD